MMDYATYLPLFLAAYAILLLGSLSPGPAVALLLGVATQQGRGAALFTTAGIACGSATLNLLTIFGVGLLLSQTAWAMTALRIVGSAYLLYLAWGSFGKALNPPNIGTVTEAPARKLALFAKGYLMQVTNPKAVAFWLAISAVGATAGAGPAVIAAFVAGGFVLSFLCHGAWGVMLAASPVRRAYQAARRWVEGALGTFFAIFAFKLATAER